MVIVVRLCGVKYLVLNIVHLWICFVSGSYRCWRRKCTAIIPPSGAKISWEECRGGRFLSTQVNTSSPALLSQLLKWKLGKIVAQTYHCLVISAPPVARPLYYSSSPASVDLSTCGSVSPARKAASVLEPSPGIKTQGCGSTRRTPQESRRIVSIQSRGSGDEIRPEVCVSVVGEKRKPSEPLHHEENKRPRVLGDIPMDLINEVMSTIADPAAIPEVITSFELFVSDEQRNNVTAVCFSADQPAVCSLRARRSRPPGGAQGRD